jgi:C1q domain
MKRVLFVLLFVSFKMFGQAPKMDVVVSTTENIDGVRAIVKNTTPSSFYSAIKGQNNSTNSFGYGVQGIHLGSGYGVYGQSVNGFAVAGFSSNIGVFGRGDLGGVLGQSINGTGITGASSTGVAGYFESGTGYALITGTGNVGLGLTTPTLPLDVNGRIRLRNNGGNNTSGIWYDNDAGFQRVFVGMETNDLFGFYGSPGWSFRFNATNGNIGISTVPTTNKLEVNGSIGSASLVGTGNNQLYANATGTIIATAPVAFSVKNPNNISIANITATVFPFSTENYDLGGFFDNSIYEFSAPLNGIYHFDCAVTFGVVNSAFSTSGYEMTILVDGGVGGGTNRQDLKVGGDKTLTLSQDIKLNAGQKVKLSVYQNSGNSIMLLGSYSFFTGHLVTRL